MCLCVSGGGDGWRGGCGVDNFRGDGSLISDKRYNMCQLKTIVKAKAGSCLKVFSPVS